MPPVEDRIASSQSQTSEPKAAGAFTVKNVLFATDFSATSEAALPYATAICRRFGATLHVAHVVSDAGVLMMTGGVDYVSLGTLYDDATAEAKQALEQFLSRFEGIPHRSYVRHGAVWYNLASIIEENKVDLIVLGTHGRTGLGKLLLGSVAENILRHAPCPVLTIGPKVAGRDKLPAFCNHGGDLAPAELDLRQILCTTNFAQSSFCVAEKAVALAEEFSARLTLLHVIEDYVQLASRPAPIEEGYNRLTSLIPPEAKLQYMPDVVIEFGSASERILRSASDREVDLIVVGARRSEDAGSTHFPWSTTYQVIAHAHCPVLTVRG